MELESTGRMVQHWQVRRSRSRRGAGALRTREFRWQNQKGPVVGTRGRAPGRARAVLTGKTNAGPRGLRAAYGNVRKPEGDVVGSTRLESSAGCPLSRGIAVEGNASPASGRELQRRVSAVSQDRRRALGGERMANAMVSRCVALPATETARRRLAILLWTV